MSQNPFAKMPIRGAYIHIPFCLSKCHYCDFLSLPLASKAGQVGLGHPRWQAMEQSKSWYTDALVMEIEACWQQENEAGVERFPLSSLYFGGGTPSLMSAEQIDRIIQAVKKGPDLIEDCELTLEANPASCDVETLRAYKEAGINRLSIGVQTLDEACLGRLNRAHSAEEALSFIESARSIGFSNLSIDLMIGLPGQSLESLARDCYCLMNYAPEHISIYSLTIEEGTIFDKVYGKEARLGEKTALATIPKPFQSLYASLPQPEEERRMYHWLRTFLTEQGYLHYELSNFAKPGFESRHNSLYWRAEPYYGFGLGASSYREGWRLRNEHRLPLYLERAKQVRRREACVSERVQIDHLEAQREFFLLGLRCLNGVSYRRFEELFGEPVPDWVLKEKENLQEQGLLLETGEGFALSEKGLDFGNQVFMAFVGE